MIRSKRKFAVFGLCAAVLGGVVFGASAGQAEEGANWMVKEKNISLLSPLVQIKELVGSSISLNATSGGGTKIEILCTAAEFLNAKLGSEGSISSGNTTKFTGCVTKLNGVISSSCPPRTKGQAIGIVESEPLKGLLILNEGKPIIEFKPVAAGKAPPFVVLLMGEECTIGEELPVTGTSTVEDENGKFTTEAVTHTVRQGPGSKLIFGGVSATVSGAAVLELAGEHKGLAWSALPG